MLLNVEAIMWNLILLFILICHSKGELTHFEIPKYTSALTQAITDIVFNFYANESTTINIIYSSTNENSSEGLHDMINEVLYQLDDVVFELVDHLNIKYSKRKKEYNIIFCDTFESFQNVFIQMHTDNFEYQGYYLIAISQYSEHIFGTISNIFGSLWSLQIVNANILWMPPATDEETVMFTYYPYTRYYCSEAYPVQLNHFHAGKWMTDINYFPKKTKNFYGCKLRVATFANAPFSIIRQHAGKIEHDGIDGILLRVLSQRMNFTVELHVDNRFLWGDVDKNGTATGWFIPQTH